MGPKTRPRASPSRDWDRGGERLHRLEAREDSAALTVSYRHRSGACRVEGNRCYSENNE
jgi:hypothetical protein